MARLIHASARSSTAAIRGTFAMLIAAQTAHSIEEYVGRLWESFPPAALVTGMVSADREQAFIVLNALLVLFGLWCVVVPVRRGWRSGFALMWLWVVVEMINGIVHPAWSLIQQAYTPGVVTAPALFVLSSVLAVQLHNRGSSS